MKKLVYLLAPAWLMSCGHKNEDRQEKVPMENHSSWQAAATGINDDSSAMIAVEKEPLSAVPGYDQGKPEGPSISKGDWGIKYAKRSFLYSPYIDSVVEQKNKNLRAGQVQSDGWNSTIDVLGEKFLQTLQAKDLTYYCLAWPAYYSQNCSAFPIPEDGGHYIAQFFPVEKHISGVQALGLRNQQDAVCVLLKKLMAEKDTIHVEVLDLIHRANLTGLLPDLCKKADIKINPYVYTLFINMMNSNRYLTFTRSGYYNRLLKQMDARGFLVVKKGDTDSLVHYALAFYRSQHTLVPNGH